MKTPKADPSSIGNILLRMKLVTQEQLDAITDEQRSMREDLLMGNLMVAKGWITKEQLELALAAQQGMRTGGRNGQALAVAELSLAHSRNGKEQRERVVMKGAAVEQAFMMRLAGTRRA